jgi:hypothetical protein
MIMKNELLKCNKYTLCLTKNVEAYYQITLTPPMPIHVMRSGETWGLRHEYWLVPRWPTPEQRLWQWSPLPAIANVKNFFFLSSKPSRRKSELLIIFGLVNIGFVISGNLTCR